MYEERIVDDNFLLQDRDESVETPEEYKRKYDQNIAARLAESSKKYDQVRMYDKIVASITGFAIGDALGVPIEFKTREELKNNPVTDMIGYGCHNMPEGTWSDDTSMTLATMDSVIELETINYDDIMKRFIQWYTEGKYTATGKTFDMGNITKKALDKYIRGYNYEKCGSTSFYENGNGSLMRMTPLAIYFSLIDLSEQQKLEMIYYLSGLTHANEVSLLGCRIYCDLFKELLNGKSVKDACLNLSTEKYDSAYDDSMICYKRIFDGSILDMPEEQIKSTGYVVDTLEATIWCLGNSSNYKEAVLKAVNLGGDADTIGAITGSLATVMYGYNSIPSEWEEKLKEDEMIYDKSYEFLQAILKIKDKNDLDKLVSGEVDTQENIITK